MTHAATPATRDATTPVRVTSTSGVPRDPDAIQAEMESVRQRLAGTIDQLVYRAHPKTIAQREFEKVKAHFVDAEGNPRNENVSVAAGAVLGVIVVMTIIRKVVNRH